MARSRNPFSFTRGPVTIIISLIYVIILAIVIVTQTSTPSIPTSATPIQGINLTEAWNDLQFLSAQYHPYNSRRNDVVHEWLLKRIKSILKDTEAQNTIVFEADTSNLTFSSDSNSLSRLGISVYFEGTNIVVYIRGTEDDQGEWWLKERGKPTTRNGILVNAHYDSVSTGFGATDDGVGVVSILQLIRHYTTDGNTPKNGFVMLLNNGEEDFLNGANAFSQHPMSRFPSSFLNLEGAGAGGRAALFRSTDEEVTKAYARSPSPFGTVVFGDAFASGLIRSQTDYVVFNGKLGLRGLDVAFIAPRARYHTDQDDSRHTGKKAIWHMLSAAVATTRQLTRSSLRIDTGNEESDSGHRAVWFDLLGKAFVLMQAHTFFALAVTVLVVGPVLLSTTLIALYRADKLYLFSASRGFHTASGDEHVPLGGWKGFFRFPFVFLLAGAAPVALAYLLFKENPYIAHSSQWAIWTMMLSSFLLVGWFFAKALDFARPSALTRAYGLSWLCGLWWIFLIAATVLEEHYRLGGGYPALFYSTSLFLATWLSYLELSSVPKKSKYVLQKLGVEPVTDRSRSHSRAPTQGQDGEPSTVNDDDEVNESSSLLRSRGRSAYKNYTRADNATEETDPESTKSLKDESFEQEWSRSLWSSLWVVEFILVVPFNAMILGQLGLNLVAGLAQTGADGSSMFTVYVSMAVLTILIFLPTLPLIHRLSWQVPIFLLFVLVGTISYNLLAFPFSPQNRLKLFFLQEVDLEYGNNTVHLTGVDGFLQDAISSIPSSAGKALECNEFADRTRCSWPGLAPHVASPSAPSTFDKSYESWLTYNVTTTKNNTNSRTAQFILYGKNTRSCKLLFDTPVTEFHVKGQGPVDKRFPPVSGKGSKEIRLWSRRWSTAWTVDVTWSKDDIQTENLSGKVVCSWSDANQRGIIPAFDEVRHFAPEWVAVTKAADGLVEGYKRFEL